MGNAMVLVLHLSKNTAFAIFSQFLVILVKISPTPPRHPVRGTLLKKTNIFHWQFRWQILSKFIIGKSFKVPVVFYSRLHILFTKQWQLFYENQINQSLSHTNFERSRFFSKTLQRVRIRERVYAGSIEFCLEISQFKIKFVICRK